MTEQEVIELAKKNYVYLNDVPRELITKNVIDNMQVKKSRYYYLTLEGINPECISKEKALQLLVYDKEIYGLLTKELQADLDVLEITTKNIEQLPKALFSSKDGLNYILDKWNVGGKSWAVGDLEMKGLIIKRDINIKKYIFYRYGMLWLNESSSLEDKFLNQDFDCVEVEIFMLENMGNGESHFLANHFKHLD